MPANDPSQQPGTPEPDPQQTVVYRPQQGQPTAQYGQPQYGQPTAQYGQPQYGQPTAQYGQPQAQPQYGQPAGQYGQPQGQPQYGQPAGQYGQPQAQPQYGQPAGQYGQPQYGYQQQAAYSAQPSWAQGSEAIGGGQAQQQPRKRPGWLLPAIAALIVALLGGGGYFAVNLLSGGGAQPQDVLPGNAIGYMRIDLDPAANQKLALFNIGRKFTVTKDSFSGDDPRQAVIDLLQRANGTNADFAKDVEPWLGHRAGIAFLAPEKGKSEPEVVAAVQVTDQDAAREGIAKLSEDGDKTAMAFRDDYVLLGSNQKVVDQAAAAESTLAQNADFTGDMSALGEPGVLSFWMDLDEVAKIAQSSGQLSRQEQAQLKQIEGARMIGALRFGDDYAELAGVVRGAKNMTTAEPAGAQLTGLPASTVGALSISGLGEILNQQWSELVKMAPADATGQTFEQQLAQFQQATGLRLPQDLVTLLGKNVTVALDERGLNGQVPNVGVRLATDPQAAQQVVAKLERLITQLSANSTTTTTTTTTSNPAPIFKASGDGTYVIASSQQYANQLAQSGTLGESETFQAAIPDAANATFALFVDLDKIENLYLQNLQGDDRANAQVLRAVGLSGSMSDDQANFSLRVLFN